MGPRGDGDLRGGHGVGTNREPARVEQDVVTAAIIPSGDGGVLVVLRPYLDDPAT